MMLQISNLDKEMSSPAGVRSRERFGKMLAFVDARLKVNEWLAGDEFSAADIMTLFTLTTMRSFYPYDLSEYQGILGYLERIVKREGYRKARSKADPDLEVMIDGKPPRTFVEKLKAEGKL
jgi:glutathione S-transferase